MAYTSSRSPRNPQISSRNRISSRVVNSRVVNSLEENIDEHDSDSEDEDQEYLLYAQKLNNNAALCIDIGYYEKATQSLQKALEFSQKLSDENLTRVCRCNGCSKVDGCIDFSFDFEPSSKTNFKDDKETARRRSKSRDDFYDSNSDDDDNYIRKRTLSREDLTKLTKCISNPKVKKLALDQRNKTNGEGKRKNATWSIQDEYCDEEMDRDVDDDIYKRPIRVVREGHPMGSALFLVITFNLALTHHLEVVSNFNRKRYNTKAAQKALLFYELTSGQEKKMLYESNNCWDYISSIRFNTILNSNLDQLLQYLPEKSVPAAHRLVTKTLRSIDEATRRLVGRSSRKARESKNSKGSKSSHSSRGSGGSRASKGSRSSRENGSGRSLQRSKSRDFMDTRMSPRSTLRQSQGRSRKVNRSSSSKLQKALGNLAPALS